MQEISDSELRQLRADAARYNDAKSLTKLISGGVIAVIVVIIGLIFVWKLVTPQMNLYRSNTEKQAVIKEQEAISEAEVFAAQKRVIAATAEAEARRIEAQGIADAQALIAATLTPEYLQWRYYEVLATTENQVIYVPTEAALPITEAKNDSKLEVEVTTP